MGEPSANSTADAAVVQIDEPRYLGVRLKGETVLEDSEGKRFALAELLGKPVILLLSYYGCDGSCPTMNAELARALQGVKRFKLGADYRVLTLSFDARDTAAGAAEFLKKTGVNAASLGQGWRHAVLPASDSKEFAASVGFRFFWSDAARAFMHPNVLIFLTPEGRIGRYIYGSRMDSRTLELALIDADWERISESAAVFDVLTGACYSYNYAEGKYGLNYALLAGVGSLLLGLLLMAAGAWAYHGKKRREIHVG